MGEVTLTATDAHLISESPTLWLWPVSGLCQASVFFSLVLCARSFSAVVTLVLGGGPASPTLTGVHPFVYGFSSTPVLKEMLQKLQFSCLFHPLFHLTTSQMTFPFFPFSSPHL